MNNYIKMKKQLEKNNNEKDKKIVSLKDKIFDLSETIEFWNNKFNKIISFIYEKIYNWYEKD